mmetsp:Transcript_17419/g.48101  ORF Transcript_17419/g.48101 Transcript_17419/m.48101 type:complete len:234 (-) Transcript_17419:411-1112(-)
MLNTLFDMHSDRSDSAEARISAFEEESPSTKTFAKRPPTVSPRCEDILSRSGKRGTNDFVISRIPEIPTDLNSDPSSSVVSATTKGSRESSLSPSPCNSGIDVLFFRASIAASFMTFLLSLIPAFMIGPYTTLPSFPCASPSTEPRTNPIVFAASGLRLLCESDNLSRIALKRSTRGLIFDVSNNPLLFFTAFSTSSIAAFLAFHAVFPSLEPILSIQSEGSSEIKSVFGISI